MAAFLFELPKDEKKKPGNRRLGGSGNIKLNKKGFKRRYKRSVEKYSSMIDLMERSCRDYSDVLKNPFRKIKGDESGEDLLDKLGSSDKILGILQCYDYFAPLSESFRSTKTLILIIYDSSYWRKQAE